MRFAYADPPYLGCARYYDHPEALQFDDERNHRALLNRLVQDFPDGWAFSLSSSSLSKILSHAPQKARVAAWVKPSASFKPGVNPAYAWEPVIFYGGRRRARSENTVRDWCSASITLKNGLTGAKPEAFCNWILDLLGYQDGDELVDLFPGSGVMGRVLQQRRMAV